MRKKLIFIVPAAIAGIAVFIALGGALVMLLWNWLLPTLFGWRLITFWQAVGLLALCRILFGRSGVGHGVRSGSWRRTRGGWMRMTAEEREKWREELRARWARPAPPPSDAPSNP